MQKVARVVKFFEMKKPSSASWEKGKHNGHCRIDWLAVSNRPAVRHVLLFESSLRMPASFIRWHLTYGPFIKWHKIFCPLISWHQVLVSVYKVIVISESGYNLTLKLCPFTTWQSNKRQFITWQNVKSHAIRWQNVNCHVIKLQKRLSSYNMTLFLTVI